LLAQRKRASKTAIPRNLMESKPENVFQSRPLSSPASDLTDHQEAGHDSRTIIRRIGCVSCADG
jgi:hypothetical protein